MGDLRACSPEPRGLFTDDRLLPLPSLSNPNPPAIGAAQWARAENTVQEIICEVQPTEVSEERRKEVVDYVQGLIRVRVGCEVFPFGSVPLKTYLPDGDIDLTAFGGPAVEDTLAYEVYSVLEAEDQNRAAEFVVKDVQLIHAEVKLVKCLVQNIVVDISFNQLGGLCTLCFLEQIDRLIGKDHLFKRSIILIKAWCYYESRILGAHHGLISTYALETLVLYIFHLFHSLLNGPLAVLYKFLDYFSKFDWDNYCVSLNGPVRISSLPEMIAETPENVGADPLLNNDILRDCLDRFSVPSRGLETNSRTFVQKHFNIVDPLKENNNLGRSVSKGNFYRIRSAFTYGARKLGRILLQPEDKISEELCKFFTNTLERHGRGQRPDVDLIPVSCSDGFGFASSISDLEFQEEKRILEVNYTDSRSITGESELDAERSMCDGVNCVKISGTELGMSNPQRGSKQVVPTSMLSEADNSSNAPAVSGFRISGDAKDLASPRIRGPKISNDTSKSSPPSGEESVSVLSKKAHFAPHLYFSRSAQNGKERNENLDKKLAGNSGLSEEESSFVVHHGLNGNQSVNNHELLNSFVSNDVPPGLSPTACSSEYLHTGNWDRPSSGNSGNPEAPNSLADLSGDYDSHFNSLQYGWWCYDYIFGAPALSMPVALPSQFQSNNSWDAIQQSAHIRRNIFPQITANGIIPRPPFYPLNPPMISGTGFGVEEMPKPRGTGTYFPNTSHHLCNPLTSRGRNQAPVRSPRHSGRAVTPHETNFLERSSRELSHAQFPVHQGNGKSGSLDSHPSGSPVGRTYSNANGSLLPSEKVVEFGDQASESPLPENIREPNHGSFLPQNSSLSLSPGGAQRPKSMLSMNDDRVAVQAYHLKDEDDFPPLSV